MGDQSFRLFPKTKIRYKISSPTATLIHNRPHFTLPLRFGQQFPQRPRLGEVMVYNIKSQYSLATPARDCAVAERGGYTLPDTKRLFFHTLKVTSSIIVWVMVLLLSVESRGGKGQGAYSLPVKTPQVTVACCFCTCPRHWRRRTSPPLQFLQFLFQPLHVTPWTEELHKRLLEDEAPVGPQPNVRSSLWQHPFLLSATSWPWITFSSLSFSSCSLQGMAERSPVMCRVRRQANTKVIPILLTNIPDEINRPHKLPPHLRVLPLLLLHRRIKLLMIPWWVPHNAKIFRIPIASLPNSSASSNVFYDMFVRVRSRHAVRLRWLWQSPAAWSDLVAVDPRYCYE